MLESLFDKVAGLRACNFIEKRLQHRSFPVHIANFYIFWKTANGCFWLFFYYGNLFVFVFVSLQVWRKTMIFMAIIEIRLCNPRRMILKGMSKSLKYMVKFNVSILNRLFVMGFFCKCKVCTYTCHFKEYLYFPARRPLLGPWLRPWPPIGIYRPWPPTWVYRPWSPICIYRPWL